MASVVPVLGMLPEPDPPWVRPDDDLRFVFTMPPRLRYCMVKLPTEPDTSSRWLSVTAFSNHLEIPSRILQVDERELTVMLNASTVQAGSPVELYVRRGDGDPVAVSAVGPLDPAPLSGDIRRVLGQDYPRSWAEHVFQRRNLQQPLKAFRAISFDHAARESNLQQVRRDEWRRSASCIELRSWVRVTEPGEYRFAVQGEQSVFLLWGEEERPVVEKFRSDGHSDETDEQGLWTLAPPILLQAGIYPMRIIQISRRVANARAGWIPPGASEPVEWSTDHWMSGQDDLPALRRESLRGVVHAAFETNLQPGYQFRDTPTVFASVHFRAFSVNWMNDPLTHQWTIGGKEVADKPEFRMELPAGIHDVSLVSRNTHGFESRSTRKVRIPSVAMEEFRLSGSLQGIPSVCYETDQVWPDLWVSGSLPTRVPLQARLTVRSRNGRTKTRTKTLRLVQEWAQLRGEEVPVESVESVEWEILHGGVSLARQTVRFVRQPFSTLPERVFGNELHAGPERILLVVRRAALEDPPARPQAPPPPPLRIVCLDSTLAPPGWHGGDAPEAFHERLRSLLSNGKGLASATVERMVYDALAGNSEGSLRTLAPLSELDRIQQGDLVVISLGLEAYVDREPLGSFERRLAALAGLLREAVGAEVILVTPPPFDHDREALRPYAEVVLRVADAYGLVVADVFSAFAGHTRPRRLTQGLRVTREGQALAAGVVGRALQQHWSLHHE